MQFDAVVLAGGRSSRMGVAKSGLVFEGRPLVEVAVAAARGARRTVVVGPSGVAPAAVLTAREDPPWGGPAAALGAGLDRLAETAAEWVLVLACDLPRAEHAVDALLAAARPHTSSPVDAIVAVDGRGRRQPLLALYRADALVRAVASARSDGGLEGLPLRRLVGSFATAEVVVDDAVCADVDTPAQARAFGIEVVGAAVI